MLFSENNLDLELYKLQIVLKMKEKLSVFLTKEKYILPEKTFIQLLPAG